VIVRMLMFGIAATRRALTGITIVTTTTPKKPRYTDAGYSGWRATSALTNRRRHGRSYPGARVRWAALRGSGILPAPNQLLPTVRREHFEKASRSAGSIPGQCMKCCGVRLGSPSQPVTHGVGNTCKTRPRKTLYCYTLRETK
jgi:hypothetical protein